MFIAPDGLCPCFGSIVGQFVTGINLWPGAGGFRFAYRNSPVMPRRHQSQGWLITWRDECSNSTLSRHLIHHDRLSASVPTPDEPYGAPLRTRDYSAAPSVTTHVYYVRLDRAPALTRAWGNGDLSGRPSPTWRG
jgi:hypothetical protein